MFPAFQFTDPQLRVLAASPMNRQDDLARRLVNVGDDVGNKGAQELLTSSHCYVWGIPCGIEVVGKPGKVRRGGNRIR